MAAIALPQLRFDNRSLALLPCVTPANPRVPVPLLPGAVFALVEPTKLKAPKIVALSPSVFKLLGVDPDSVKGPEAASLLCGAEVWSTARPAAHCYAGHQFGYFSGQLGDGATMYIGEIVNPDGQRWEMQWKGAGLTPFSRQADGRKVYRSSLREFLASEHLHALGVPTTRAASLVVSEDTVVRDEFYDGRPRREHCAVVVRVAESFIRFGSFEIARPIDGKTGMKGPATPTEVRALFDYVRRFFYPEEASALEVVQAVAARTAVMVAHWQALGFTHGVMNTDNMSILGLTLDYGPYGFMQVFDPCYVPNFSDENARYRYNAQPDVALWNISKLLETLSLAGILVASAETEEKVRTAFQNKFQREYTERFRRKLGLLGADGDLVEDLLQVMHQTAADWTNVFFALLECGPSSKSDLELFETVIAPNLGTLDDLLGANAPLFELSSMAKLLEIARMGRGSDVYEGSGLTEKDLAHQLLRHERFAKMKKFTAADKRRNDSALWTAWLAKYRAREFDAERESLMRTSNPRFVLRNGVAQMAVTKSNDGQSPAAVEEVLALCLRPFALSKNDEARFLQVPEQCIKTDSTAMQCSCSS